MKSPNKETVELIVQKLDKAYGPFEKVQPSISILDLIIRFILSDAETRENAQLAYEALRNEFVDWNEVRVSHPREISEVLERHLSHEIQEKAHKLREFLFQAFQQCHSMNLEFLWEYDFNEIQKFLQQFPEVKEDFMGELLLYSYARSEPLISSTSLRVGKRLGLWSETISLASLKKSFLKHIENEMFVKLHGLLFIHGRRVCHPKGYKCEDCILSLLCQQGKKELVRHKKERKKNLLANSKKKRGSKVSSLVKE